MQILCADAPDGRRLGDDGRNSAALGRVCCIYCLRHVLKNVFRNCTSSFANNDDRATLMSLFQGAAYAVTPEVRL